MSTDCKTVLITRPGPYGLKDRDWYINKGFFVQFEPIIIYREFGYTLPQWDDFSALIVTSQKSLDVFQNRAVPDIPVFCVGRQTAAKAAGYGFNKVYIPEGGNAESLVSLITGHKDSVHHKPLLYLRGASVSMDIKAALFRSKIAAEELIVYQTIPAQALSDQTTALLRSGKINAVTFYSKKTARIFADLIRTAALENTLVNIKALCLSDAVLECVRPLNWKSTHVSPAPDGDVFRSWAAELLQCHDQE